MSLVSPLRVTKQRVHLSVEIEPLLITGYTDIDFAATTSTLPTNVFLNARQLTIDLVTCGGSEVPFQSVDSHAALKFSKGRLVRDASHYATVAQIVNESPDLIIPHAGLYPASFHIEFRLNEGCTSIVSEHGYIFTDNRVDGPSGWFPCLDTLAQRTMFTLTIEHSASLVCLGSGNPTVISADAQTGMNVTMFKIPYPIQAHALGFALGPFIGAPVEGARNCMMYHTGGTDGESFRNTLQPVPSLLQKIGEKFSFLEDPLDMNLNFVSLTFLTECIVWPNLIFVPNSMMSPVGNLNVIYTVVPKLIEALVGQFVYFLFPVGDPRDRWIQDGICALFADIIAAQFFSTSFRLERRWNDLNWLMTEDIHPAVVLRAIDPVTGQQFTDKFLRVKVKLLMNMIVTSLRNQDMQLVSLMEPAIKRSQELNSGFVTEHFLNDLKRFCPNIKFTAFRQQWLCSNGFPIFTYNFTNDTRHNNLRLVLAQTPSCKTRVPFFTGQMLVHLQDLDQPYEFPFAVENQIQMQHMSYFAHRKKTKTKEFTFQNEQQTKITVHHAVMWLLIDAPMAWICRVRPRLPEFMITYQLELLRNVFAQHEAVSALQDFAATDLTLKMLSDMLKNEEV
jgi:transcription initiation factor TFIID subunit 2